MKKKNNKINNRNLIIQFFCITICIIFILKLINLQIINGKSYRELSGKRNIKVISQTAKRGNIYDKNGILLAGTKIEKNVLLYKIKEDNLLNDKILKLIEILEESNDTIYTTFPINENYLDFENDEKRISFLKENKLDENYSFYDVISYYEKKYNLSNYLNNEKIKIICIRYECSKNGMSSTKGVIVAKNVSDSTYAKILENSVFLNNVFTTNVPVRYYPNENIASHLLGYVAKISSEEYEQEKNNGYNINSYYGKMGIEKSFENYLKGIDGEAICTTTSDGIVTQEQLITQPINGKNLYLTIDYNLQVISDNALKETLLELQKNGYENATAGSVLILDSKTSEVLAMSSYPTFDSNDFIH